MNLLKQICMVLLALSVSPLSEAAEYTIKGDIRYRYENVENNRNSVTSRERIRTRIGVYGNASETVSFGTRIATGGDGVTSTNETIENEAANKDVGLDLAYLTIDSLLFEGVDTTLGKMKQPWKSVSDLIYDSDLTPEGIAFSYTAGKISYHVGRFILEEDGGNDPELSSAQAVLNVSDKLTVGASIYDFSDLDIIDPANTRELSLIHI